MNFARTKKDGFVLIAVIWLAGLIAAAATGLALKVRVDTLATANVIHNSQAELIADGVAKLVALRLAGEQPLRANGSPSLCRWSTAATVDIRVQDQAGLIDLNTTDAAFFEGVFKKLGAATEFAHSLSSALQDFRDLDSLNTEGLAEPQTYPGQRFGPKNAPFQAIEELAQLPDMTDQLYRAILPVVTVHAAQPGVDQFTAPDILRKMFGEITPGEFTGELKDRSGPPQGKIFGLDIRVKTNSGGRYRRYAIVSMVRQPERPFAIMAWQNRLDWNEEPPQDTSIPPCFN